MHHHGEIEGVIVHRIIVGWLKWRSEFYGSSTTNEIEGKIYKMVIWLARNLWGSWETTCQKKTWGTECCNGWATKN